LPRERRWFSSVSLVSIGRACQVNLRQIFLRQSGLRHTGLRQAGLRHTFPSVVASATAITALIGSALLQPLQAQPQIYLAPFYAATDKLNPNGKPLGTVLASEPVSSSVKGSKAWRIAYVSSDPAGRRTVTTGLIAVPDGPVPPGGRPLVGWAHGTTGTARRCGPSQDPQPAQPLNQVLLPSGTTWSDVGLPAMEPLLKRGVVIVATDYQGLGGPGQHQFGQAISNGMDVINALRAARDFRPAAAGERAVVYGWSQGGGAVLGVAGLGSTQSSKDAVAAVNIIGAVAMAPQDVGITIPAAVNTEESATAFLVSLNRQFSGNVLNFAHLAMMYWGLAAAQPGLQLGDLFTSQAANELNGILQRKCVHELSASFSYSYGNTFAGMLKAQPSNALAWVQALRNLSPSLNPTAPVAIYWGNNDTVVPPEMHKLYFEAACKRGAVISRTELPGNNTHFSTPAAAQPIYVPWILERFAGQPVVNGCPTS
jgi:pimeloyl-ACP methyl ester carboxylesterase